MTQSHGQPDDTGWILQEFLIRFHMIWPWCTTWREFPVICFTCPIYRFSHLTTHITYNSGESEQVDPLQTLYKMSRSHLPEVSSTIHYFSFLFSKKKTDLIVGKSLTELHWSLLTVLSFFLGPTTIAIVRNISTY